MLTGLTRSLNALLPSMPIAGGSSVAQATPARWTRRVPTGNFFRSAHPSIGTEETHLRPAASCLCLPVRQTAVWQGTSKALRAGWVRQKYQDRRCVREPIRLIYRFERRWECADRSNVQKVPRTLQKRIGGHFFFKQ